MLAFIFCIQFACAQQRPCYNGISKRRPYYETLGYPSSTVLNLLEREHSNRLHFGFGLGLNVFDFSHIELSKQTVNVPGQGNVILSANMSTVNIGFNINAIINYRLITNLDVRLLPGIFFGQRQLDFVRMDTDTQLASMSIVSNYIEFPLHLKYSAMRFNNFRPYVIAGFNPRVNLSNTPSEDAKRYIGLKKLEPFAEFGFGFDFYRTYFRMGLEFKMSAGLVNCLSDKTIAGEEYFREALTGLKSNMMVFTLNFEL